MKKACLFAKELGAKHAALGGGAIRSGGIRKDDHEKLAKGLEKAAEMIDKIGLIPSYHPHLGTIVQAPDQLDKLMALTNVNLCPDCAHIEAGGGSSVEVVKKYADRIKYLHLKDFKDGQFLPLGMGTIDFKEMLKTLEGKGVDYTVEVDGYPGDPYEGAVTSYRYLEPLLK
jgi:inosose dehydratase